MHISIGWAPEALRWAAVVGVVAALAGCAPLPQGALDPVTPLLGLSPRAERLPDHPPNQAPVPPGAYKEQ